ncbi:hypothetical protein ACFWD7_57835 [Streptomyces mirabilis]|uniref:hypothetical protein n=1 Tax=Streptomyces mirabilis TaxID=68239 RepID=UPI00369D3033
MRSSREDTGPVSTADSYAHTDVPGIDYFDLAKKFTLTAAMSVVSPSYPLKNLTLRSVGFGVLSTYHAESSVEAGFKDPGAAVLSGVNALGTAAWAVGIGTGNSIAQTVGPAVNAAANFAFAGLKVHQNKGGWFSKVADAAEMTSFAAAGATQGSPLARGMAFTFAGISYLAEAPKDPAYVGHAVSMGVWAAGAFMQNNVMQGIGAGGLAFSEAARTFIPFLQKPQQDLERGVTPATPASIGSLPFETAPPIDLAAAAGVASAANAGIPELSSSHRAEPGAVTFGPISTTVAEAASTSGLASPGPLRRASEIAARAQSGMTSIPRGISPSVEGSRLGARTSR